MRPSVVFVILGSRSRACHLQLARLQGIAKAPRYASQMANVGSLESQLRTNFALARAERDIANGVPLAAADRMAVRAFQQKRLAATHADLLASSEYGPAAHFFLTELYSTDDMTQRDADIERVIKILVRFLPDKALSTLAVALEMDALSEHLDGKMVAALRAVQNNNESLKIDANRYQRTYRNVGQPEQRLRQIALTQSIGGALDQLARKPLLRGLLRMMRTPAVAGGVGSLHEFLERGYAAFAHMDDGQTFIKSIAKRERDEHDRLMT